MGSSDKESGVVDCSVGTIVWVRRRNGSWWPGKILGPEELSAAHLMSPRSGTPVKLLGREDASVDWYNLEKSKRVKAFRCGEFDDCIERAESSQGMPPKKREKYARREDAILHALELEKQLLEKKYGKLGCSSNGMSKSSYPLEEELVAPLKFLENGNGKAALPKSHSRKLDSTLEDKSMDHHPDAQEVKEENLLAGYEDDSEIIPRTRGMRDFGLRIAHSKRKLSSSITLSHGSRKPEFDDNAPALPSSVLSTENTVHANSSTSLDKRKKLQEMLTNDESLHRKRDRRRPIVQVLKSSPKLPIRQSLQPDDDYVSVLVSGEEQTGDIHHAKRSRCIGLPGESSDCSDDNQFCSNQMVIPPSQFKENYPLPAALGEENTSISTESTETDSSGTDSLDSDADEEMASLSDAAVVAELEPKALRRSGEQVQHGRISSEEPDDWALSSPRDPVLNCMEVSKWKMKGKRNNRGLSKRSGALNDRRFLRDSMFGTSLDEMEDNACDEPALFEKNFRNRRGAFDNRGYLLTSKSRSKGLDVSSPDIINWENSTWNDQSVLKGYWDDSSNYDPIFIGRHNFGSRMKSMLVDVDLKVQSSYQREHVPMISLMSKLNGQAIVGHPIQIEALENGSSKILLSATESPSDNDTAPPPMWRTARRTANVRVPRPHPSSALDGEETAEHFQHADQDKKVQFRKSNIWSFGHRANTARKSILTRAPRPPSDRKYSRKPLKKISISSSQKIKALSSIGTEQTLGNDSRHGSNNYQLDGLIKGESGPTAVACIPVKLVFSRLYEELVGRHQ
ncbi:hypothetical protein U1Q18_004935 [Sarracenia purpurea var. burkii]